MPLCQSVKYHSVVLIKFVDSIDGVTHKKLNSAVSVYYAATNNCPNK